MNKALLPGNIKWNTECLGVLITFQQWPLRLLWVIFNQLSLWACQEVTELCQGSSSEMIISYHCFYSLTTFFQENLLLYHNRNEL